MQVGLFRSWLKRRATSAPLWFAIALIALVTIIRALWQPKVKRQTVGPFYEKVIADVRGRAAPVCINSMYQFVEYTPSKFELLWEEHANEWSIGDECTVLAQQNQLGPLQRWLDTTIPISTPRALANGKPLLEMDPKLEIFSKMRYRHNVTGEHVDVGIEPLAGILRDPRSICPDIGLIPKNDEVQSKEFLGIDPEHLRRIKSDLLTTRPRERRVILFDLGCTRWSDTKMPGLRWLFDSYSAAGLTFTDVYAWEPSGFGNNPGIFFDGMTKDVLASIHYFPRAANNEPDSLDNPLAILESVAQPDDFVVFKLDIDTPSVEKLIIFDIMRNSKYSCLIDELFFEHHSMIKSMIPWWTEENREGTLLDSIQLFQILRRSGIRAHSWP
jgi:hypothetical protein